MQKLVIGNWKANPKTAIEAKSLARSIHAELTKRKKKAVLAIPALYLEAVKSIKSKNIILGVQDVSAVGAGPHTGEITTEMLSSFGVKYAIVGHSERRANGETQALINQKIVRLLAAAITPIVCVGEISREHIERALSFIKQEVESALHGISRSKVSKIIIAYEPVWAISTNGGREATAEECKEMIIYIRKIVADMYGQVVAREIQILYGGSVSGEKDAMEFAINGGAQGFLVGRASLDPKTFGQIASV